MTVINIEISDAMKEYVDSRIGPGKFKDASAYAQWLIAEDMGSQAGDFSPEEKDRIERLLLEAMNSFKRGEAVAVRPGEFEEMARRMVEQHQRKQAS